MRRGGAGTRRKLFVTGAWRVGGLVPATHKRAATSAGTRGATPAKKNGGKPQEQRGFPPAYPQTGASDRLR